MEHGKSPKDGLKLTSASGNYLIFAFCGNAIDTQNGNCYEPLRHVFFEVPPLPE